MYWKDSHKSTYDTYRKAVALARSIASVASDDDVARMLNMIMQAAREGRVAVCNGVKPETAMLANAALLAVLLGGDNN